MERHCILKGKNITTGKWLEYDVTEMCESKYISQGATKNTVDKKTVGLFTGLLDMDGKKIFEGDILRYVSMDRYTLPDKVVYYEEEMAAFRMVNVSLYNRPNRGVFSSSLKRTIVQGFYKVVGNIFDDRVLSVL